MLKLNASSSSLVPRVQMSIMVFSFASQFGPFDSSLIISLLSVGTCFLRTSRRIWSIEVAVRGAKLSGLCLRLRSNMNRSSRRGSCAMHVKKAADT